MSHSSVRVRFAPSPTGMMHLGNVRAALLNFLFARQKNGTFILRLEDTDPERNFDPGGKQIIQDLTWLNLMYDEGPKTGGPYEPYFQSQRNHIYQEKLEYLRQEKLIYRCFCTPQELEKKRQRAIALKLPPRYDRTCLSRSDAEITTLLAQGTPFIWRFKIPQQQHIQITDMARGIITFDLNHFSDFPLNRADGSFTFIFANCIDDITMDITHILRGEDHLTNTANQALIFQTFGAPQPLFWHLPIICNVEGKKLSKRDFGFSLHDLKEAGFLPEAINNYLAIIGGSFEQEIMNQEELIHTLNFDHINPTGNIKYDVEKLRWINHKWINQYPLAELVHQLFPILSNAYPQVTTMDRSTLTQIITLIRSELITLHDVIPAVNFYFEEPTITQQMALEHIPHAAQQKLIELLRNQCAAFTQPDEFLAAIKKDAQQLAVNPKALFTVLRLALTGASKGPGIKDLITILGIEKTKKRIQRIL